MVDVLPTDRPDASQQPQPPEPDKPRMTTRYLTKYERARVLGTRALQIRCVRPEHSRTAAFRGLPMSS